MLVIAARPPIFAMRRVGFISAAEMAKMLGLAKNFLEETSQRGTLVYDAGLNVVGRPDSAVREVVSQWMQTNAEFLNERCHALDFASPNALSRGVLSAIFWLKPPPFEVLMHADCRSAVSRAAERTGSPPTWVADILAELDLQERRSTE